MAKAKKKVKRVGEPIVEAYLERIGQKVFKDLTEVCFACGGSCLMLDSCLRRNDKGAQE
ncbi:MAG: hypothetical protein H8D47_04800 [Planctomycetes bacterium]|nr:hypothetical protein [Planctomycetota bacterium]